MIVIDYQDRRPLYEQITEKFKMLIIKGVLESDTQMPSVRSLATQLAINPNTIQKAYAELERQGYIYPVNGRGNYVSPAENVAQQKKSEYVRSLKGKLEEGRDMGFEKYEVMTLVEEIWRDNK